MTALPASSSAVVHLGLIGVGRIGAMHARHLAELPEVGRLTLAGDPLGQAERVAGETGSAHCRTAAELLEAGVDGVVVAAGTAVHVELVSAAVDAGVPVLCEKPLAPDVPSSLELARHVRESGGTVMVGFQRRFDLGYAEARRAVQAGELGWITGVHAVTCDMTPPPVDFLATSGGLFRDCSVHDVDALRWITGREVVAVYARGSNRGDPQIGAVGDVDTAVAVCTLDDGTLATVTASRYNGAGHDVRMELRGSADTLVVGLDERSALRSAEPGVAFPGGPPVRTFAERFVHAYRAEMAAFVQLVRGERRNPCTPEDAIAAARVADAAQVSLETGAAVHVEA